MEQPMDGFYSSVEGGQDSINGSGKSRVEGETPRFSLRGTAAALLFLLILLTLLGNSLVCVAVIKFRHLRSKVTNFFVISLAVSDLLVAVLVMPWRAAAEAVGFWPFGAFCDIWVAFDIMCSTASILNLCIISVDRYWAISNPFCYERRMTPRVASAMVGMAWLLSLLISFIPVRLRWHKDQHLLYQQENVTQESCDSHLNRTYAISSSLISFYIPVAIMIVTYTCIFRIAQRRIRRISSLEHAQSCHSIECPHTANLRSSFKKETKVLKTLSIIVGAFVFCWLPFFVLNCVVPFCDPDQHKPCVSETVFSTFVWLGWANSSLNPIIYAFNADFRRAFITILGCEYLCPNDTVEMVNFSNELVSYQHSTSCPRDVLTLSHPHAVLQMENNEVSSEKLSQLSSHSSCPAVVQVEYEAQKVAPLTCNALN
ncbi:D(1) dopamine receptor-like [Meleagris gallopavo]|uniref:G-protein coupled receptors family 1 profile domain-containing protein n=1 Tax=Meleagris gallopavo TaxID=9103 RepID=G1NRC1_MELGA|nr:D(1) dopamine receptor-like [Meleagris gallopavo]XP_031412598.1 D(1) dopamine receptor-like [Meleagris gallopavo]